jgi:phospholipid-transporting ATPase
MENESKNEFLLDNNKSNDTLTEDEKIKNHTQIKKYTIDVNEKEQKFLTKPELHSNRICTSKYNYINALPKILCEQFSKVGNMYFLFLAILQMIPSISQSGGSPVILLPLIFVVLVNGIKDFCEDYKRKQSDNRENSNKCHLINYIDNEKSGETIKWEQLKPGNIVKIYKGEYFPCDLILLYSSNKNGTAYVETKNLDGETNLKYKESIKNTYRLLKNFDLIEEKDEVVRRIFGRIQCENPNAHLYEFEGIYNYKYKAKSKFALRSERTKSQNHDIPITGNDSIIRQDSQFYTNYFQNEEDSIYSNAIKTELLERRITRAEIEEERINPISHTINVEYNNFLLRGSSLRNTEFIYGIVVYTGHSTKIMLNSLNARSKQSKVFRIMNKQLKYVIIFEMLLCLLFSILYSCDPDPYSDKNYKLDNDLFSIIEGFIYSFLAWLLTMCNIVPISLLVTIEMIKFCQAIFISWDIKMYDEENRRKAIVQSSALNEELGQIRDIFTDKTGTLTKNVMQFKYMAIGDELYGSDNRRIFFLH